MAFGRSSVAFGRASTDTATIRQVKQSWRATLIGLAGTLLLAASAWLASPWGLGFAGRDNTMPVRIAHTVPAAAGIVLLFTGWLAARGSAIEQLWRTFLIWCTPLLVCPPLLSKDAWAYLEQGWIVVQGFDPYQTGLGTVGGPFGDRVDSYWLDTTTVYPPLALLVQAGVVELSGADPFWSLLAMRLPGVLAVALIGACLPRIARATGQDPAGALWLGLANPLLVVHFIGGVHNDAWAVALGVAGIWLAVRWPAGWPLGCVLVGLGMAVKQPIGLMMVAVALFAVAAGPRVPPRQAWREAIGPALWRLPVGLAATLVGFAVPSLVAGWGIGWATGSGAPQTTGSQSVAHTVAATVQWLTDGTLAGVMGVVGPIFLTLGAMVIGWLLWRYGASRPVTFTAWGLVAFAFTYPSLQPWYALWGGVLLGAVVLSPPAVDWVTAVTGCLLLTGVLLDHAGWPIPLVQGVALAVAWPLMRWSRRARLAASANLT